VAFEPADHRIHGIGGVRVGLGRVALDVEIVVGPRVKLQPVFDPGPVEGCVHGFGLSGRHAPVGVAMQNKRRRIAGIDAEDGRDRSKELVIESDGAGLGAALQESG